MTWQLAVFTGLALVIAGGFVWYERSRPPARLVALVAALAALAVAGRLVLAPIPNVVATTDIALITGYALGAAPGFAVGALAAPISNIWLGQGPWTAWEMAGWGLVGLAGAWLAVLTHRRLGRLGLAAFCAVAGLGYGLLLDLSVMVTYGGEQSLDRYLALSARGLPFNIAHAIGNFTIALAAGPALVRMISRYRTRMEFCWRPAPAVSALALVVAIAAGAATLGTSQPAAAKPAAKSGVDDARTWLVRSQGRDGGFAATPDNPSSPAMTGWAMLGLEAGGRNPLDVSKRGKTPVSYLRSEADRLRSVGDLERTILALDAAGIDPRKFAGANLVNGLRQKRRRDGSVAGQVNLTAFYVLAMRAADAGKLGRPSGWLRGAQNDDGGWGFRPGAASDPDSTGAALQALAAAGSGGKTTKAGVRWLRRAQRSGGGWALATSGIVNSQSTAWAIQGLVAAGSGRKPIDKGVAFLKRLRDSDGHFRYSRSSDQTPIWVTSQALLALAEKPFPLARVARRPSSDSSGSGSSSNSSGSTSSSTGGSTSSGGSAGSSYPSPSYPSTDSSWDTGSTGAGLPSGTDFTNPAGAGSGPGGSSAATAGGTSTAGEATTAAKDEPGGPSVWGALWAEALRNGADQEAGGAEGASGEDPAAAGESATEEYTPAADVSDEPVAPFVGAGFAALILALGAGFVWYRRRLP
jgi:energy-coupling factor transport system substrate-specific component